MKIRCYEAKFSRKLNKNFQNLLKLVLWKDVLSIPLYTVLFNYNIDTFWIILAIDRIVFLVINSSSINLDEIIDLALENKDSSANKLLIFSAVSIPILFILTLINNIKLFSILVIVEIADAIVLKLIKHK